MSTKVPPIEFLLQKVIKPSSEEIDEILEAMVKGFANEAFANHFSLPLSTLTLMQPAEFAKIKQMAYLGPALLNGEVWLARRKSDNAVLGVGIWSHAGFTMGDTAFYEEYHKLVSPEEAAFDARFRWTILAERNAAFPGLWRDHIHLHNLVTVPEARGRGVGSAIIGEMIKQGRELGQSMNLCTPTEPNRRFYERHGFKTIWEREVVFDDGVKEPYIVMMREATPVN